MDDVEAGRVMNHARHVRDQNESWLADFVRSDEGYAIMSDLLFDTRPDEFRRKLTEMSDPMLRFIQQLVHQAVGVACLEAMESRRNTK